MVHARKAEEGAEAPPQAELVLHDAEADEQDDEREGERDGPEDPLALVHGADVARVHAEQAGDEGQGQEDDRDGGEDEDGLVVVLAADLDRVARPVLGLLGVVAQHLEVVNHLLEV